MAANSRVVIAKSNHPDYLLYLYSTIASGGVPVSVNAGTGWRFIVQVTVPQLAEAVAWIVPRGALTGADLTLRSAARQTSAAQEILHAARARALKHDPSGGTRGLA